MKEIMFSVFPGMVLLTKQKYWKAKKINSFAFIGSCTKEEFFEFSIEKSEVTNQTILVIKDFAEKREIKDQSQLWDYQVKDLFHRLG